MRKEKKILLITYHSSSVEQNLQHENPSMYLAFVSRKFSAADKLMHTWNLSPIVLQQACPANHTEKMVGNEETMYVHKLYGPIISP